MKKYSYFLMVMLLAIVSVGFASCGKDDEPKVADIVGTWQLTEDNEVTLIQFTKDGKYNEVDIVSEEGVADLYIYHGTYTLSGNKLTLTYEFAYESETVVCTYSVKGDKLTISSAGETNTLIRVEDSVIQRYL